MATVSRTCPDLAAASMQTAEPASALRVAQPAATAINHHLGHLMNGVHVWQQHGAAPEVAGGTWQFKIRRHPNCDYLCIILELDGVQRALQDP